MLRTQQRLDESAHELKIAISRENADTRANLELGRTLVRMGKGSEAKKYLEFALTKEPDNVAALNSFAQVLYSLCILVLYSLCILVLHLLCILVLYSLYVLVLALNVYTGTALTMHTGTALTMHTGTALTMHTGTALTMHTGTALTLCCSRWAARTCPDRKKYCHAR
jgi:hypothetical protein